MKHLYQIKGLSEEQITANEADFRSDIQIVHGYDGNSVLGIWLTNVEAVKMAIQMKLYNLRFGTNLQLV